MTEYDRPIRVLHVDDEVDFAELTASFIEGDAGSISLETVTSGEAALNRLAAAEFDCVVSDYNMPEMNGIELLRTVRERYGNLPFILFTGRGSEEIASQAISAGVTDYLQKEASTSQYEVLANRIRNVVSQYRAERRAAAQERMLGVLQEVNRALVKADTVEEIHDAVTAILARTEPYRIACFAEYEAQWKRLNPRMVSGLDDQTLKPISTRDLTVDDSTVITSIRDGTIELASLDDPLLQLWEDPTRVATEVAVVIPIEYQGERHGQLILFSAEPDPLHERERELLDEIAGDVAQGLHAAAVRTELRQHQTAVEAVPEGVFLLDEDATIDLINDPAAALVNRTPEDLRGEPFPTFVEEGLFDESIVTWYLENVRTMLSSKKDREEAWYETDVHLPSGVIRRVEIHLTLRPYVDEYRGTVGIIRDITDRSRREADLERKERRFEAMFNDPNVLVAMIDTDGRIQDVNETALGYLEEERSTVVDEPFWEAPWFATAEVDAAEIRERTERAAEGEYLTCEIDIVDAAGSTRTVSGVFRPVTNEDDSVVAIVVSGRDITERREHAEELERERDRLAALFESLPNPVVHGELLDGEPIIRSVNPAFEEVFGYSVEEAQGKNLDDLTVPPGRQAEATSLNERIGETDRLRAEVTRQTTDGPREFVMDIVVREGTDGQPEGYAIDTDISERKERERELERKNERLEEFASVVSHDLRNPLNVAEGHLKLLEEDIESPHLDGMDRALNRMATLIDDLLALAREGRPVTEFEAVPLAAVARDAWDTVETTEARLEVHLDGSVIGDRTRLQQLFENLFRNAIEHGGEDVTVTVGPLDDGNGFYVADDGPGIHPDDRELIFEMGYTTSEQGTRFGLSIAEEIAAAHGWDLSATDGDHAGVVFELRGVSFDQ